MKKETIKTSQWLFPQPLTGYWPADRLLFVCGEGGGACGFGGSRG